MRYLKHLHLLAELKRVRIAGNEHRLRMVVRSLRHWLLPTPVLVLIRMPALGRSLVVLLLLLSRIGKPRVTWSLATLLPPCLLREKAAAVGLVLRREHPLRLYVVGISVGVSRGAFGVGWVDAGRVSLIR
jgi:hypothetical protein